MYGSIPFVTLVRDTGGSYSWKVIALNSCKLEPFPVVWGKKKKQYDDGLMSFSTLLEIIIKL